MHAYFFCWLCCWCVLYFFHGASCGCGARSAVSHSSTRTHVFIYSYIRYILVHMNVKWRNVNLCILFTTYNVREGMQWYTSILFIRKNGPLFTCVSEANDKARQTLEYYATEFGISRKRDFWSSDSSRFYCLEHQRACPSPMKKLHRYAKVRLLPNRFQISIWSLTSQTNCH